jgi:hypothetical protein
MARFGSFAGGLSAGLSAGLDRQGADMDRQYKGLLQRYQMTQNKLKEAGGIILKFKEAGKEVPPEMVQLVQTLAKQADEAGIALGQPEAGMNSHVMEGLLASPGAAAKKESGVTIQNRVTKKLKHFKNQKEYEAWRFGSGALLKGDEESGVDFADPNKNLEDKSDWIPVKAPTADMDDPVPAQPTKFWVTVLDENGKPTGKRTRVTDEEFDPNLHTDLKEDKENRPSLRTKITKTGDGRLAEQKEELRDGIYIPYGEPKPIEELPYTYEKLTNRAGHYLRINPNNNSRDVVDLSDLSADEQSRITAQQARADLAAGVPELEGIASARSAIQEVRSIAEQTGKSFDAIAVEQGLIPDPNKDKVRGTLFLAAARRVGFTPDELSAVLTGDMTPDQEAKLAALLKEFRSVNWVAEMMQQALGGGSQQGTANTILNNAVGPQSNNVIRFDAQGNRLN